MKSEGSLILIHNTVVVTQKRSKPTSVEKLPGVNIGIKSGHCVCTCLCLCVLPFRELQRKMGCRPTRMEFHTHPLQYSIYSVHFYLSRPSLSLHPLLSSSPSLPRPPPLSRVYMLEASQRQKREPEFSL